MQTWHNMNDITHVRNILFLDIDGVLNSSEHFNSIPKDKRYRYNWKTKEMVLSPLMWGIYRPFIEQLNYICKEVENLEIIITSQWRLSWPKEALQEYFEIEGFKYQITDMTEFLYGNDRLIQIGTSRMNEIHTWLVENIKKGERFKCVILDDEPSLLEPNRSKYSIVLTQIERGLTDRKALKVVAEFKNQLAGAFGPIII